MIFSSCVQFYRCQACASEYSSVTPTSLLPITAVIAFTTGPWARVASRVVPYRWLCVVLGVVAAIASLWLIYALVEALTTGKLRRRICPKCGAKLARTGGGFHHGIVPDLGELLIYILAIALACGLAAATGGT